MGFRNGDETVVFEGKIEHTTPKAYLINGTLGGEYWVPKSQLVQMGDPDVDGNREFTVTEWWAKRNGLA